jgi:hypothetical protein
LRTGRSHLTSKHGSACPTTNAQLVHPFQGCKAVASVDTGLASLVQLIGEDVQHELAVALRVDVPVRFMVESLSQRRSVDQVTIVRHADTVGAVDVEGLSL